jgi:hypothetical protein
LPCGQDGKSHGRLSSRFSVSAAGQAQLNFLQLPGRAKFETRKPKSEGNPKSELWPILNLLGWPDGAAGG